MSTRDAVREALEAAMKEAAEANLKGQPGVALLILTDGVSAALRALDADREPVAWLIEYPAEHATRARFGNDTDITNSREDAEIERDSFGARITPLGPLAHASPAAEAPREEMPIAEALEIAEGVEVGLRSLARLRPQERATAEQLYQAADVIAALSRAAPSEGELAERIADIIHAECFVSADDDSRCERAAGKVVALLSAREGRG